MVEEKITIILNGVEIILDNLTSYMLKDQFKEIFNNNFINLDILNSSTKIILLDRIFSLMSNTAVIMYDDEYLDSIPKGREVHNDLFNKISMIDNMIRFKSKSGESVNNYKLKKLPEIIININEYNDYMKSFDNNIKKK